MFIYTRITILVPKVFPALKLGCENIVNMCCFQLLLKNTAPLENRPPPGSEFPSLKTSQICVFQKLGSCGSSLGRFAAPKRAAAVFCSKK